MMDARMRFFGCIAEVHMLNTGESGWFVLLPLP